MQRKMDHQIRRLIEKHTCLKGFLLCGLLLWSFQAVPAQSLQELIAEAERNNPGIQAYELRYALANERIMEVNSLPETELGIGLFVSEPETRTGAQKMRFSARQMLPWFGTITAREHYAASMADAEYQEVAIAKRKLALQMAQQYYDLYVIHASGKVLEDNVQLLNTYEGLALTSVEVGRASAVDVLRLQIRQNELLQRQRVLAEDKLAVQANLNSLMNRKNSLAISMVDSLPEPKMEPLRGQDSLGLHPELIKYDRLYESILQAEALNQTEASPRLGIGVDYIPVSERPGMDFSDNGKDIIMPMVSMSIPIFNNSYKSRTRQNEIRRQEIVNSKQEKSNILSGVLANARAKRNAALIAYETHGRNLIQAREAEEIIIKSYETGTIDFNEVLEIQELQLKFQLNQIEATRAFYIQAAMINYFTGI